MKTLEEINAQIDEQVDVLKKLRAEKDRIIENLSKNYVGKYIKLSKEDGFYIMKINQPFLEDVDAPYKYYGTIFKFCDDDYQFMNDFVLFADDFNSIESLTEEEYNEFVKKFIDKILELK